MKNLIEEIVKALVDRPDQVLVTVVPGQQSTALEITTHPSDIGHVIGKQGRTITAIRLLASAASMKLKHRHTIEIME